MIRILHPASIRFVIHAAIVAISMTTVVTTGLSNRYMNKINMEISILSANAQKLQEGTGDMKYIVVNTQRLATNAMFTRNQEMLLSAPAQSYRFYELIDEMNLLIDEDDPPLKKRMEALKNEYRDFLFHVIATATQNVERIDSREDALDQVNRQANQFLHELNLVAEQISQLAKRKVERIGDYSRTTRRVNIASLSALLAAILFALFFIERKLFNPLASLMEFVREISGSDTSLAKRIPSHRRDEIGELGQSVNIMLDRLEKTTVSRDQLQKEVMERKRAEAALRHITEGLDAEVSKRTTELQRSYEELKSEILERKLAEQKNDQLRVQLLQAQKMDAIGRLAGGLAHDFNNVLTGMIMSAELAAESIGSDSKLHKNLRDIQEFGKRGGTLTRQLLTFSRQQVIKPVVLNVNFIVEGMLTMLHRLIGETIALSFQKAPEIGRIKADPGQLEQVLMNLVVNARDAMPRGGSIHIETGNVTLTHEALLISSDMEAGPYVQLCVTDTGHGMDPATRDKVFEPFFTTKPVGKGTGLGLSTVYGIVKNCSGAIDIESAPHQGTRIKILFPMTAEKTMPVSETSCPFIPMDSYRRISLRIMLVEDEETVRDSTQAILQKLGHTVTAFSDPIEAATRFHMDPKGVDLLISDVIMPGYDGPELYSRLLPANPELKVLFISGYAAHHIPQKIATHHNTRFLQKPFTLNQLVLSMYQVTYADSKPDGEETDFSEGQRLAG
jgi:signal transduction histidine kinase